MTKDKNAIIDRTMKLYVAALSDAADEIGLRTVCMDRGIVPLTKNKRMVGFARTGKLARSPATRPYDEKQLDMFMSLGTEAEDGDLLVIDMAGATDCSAWGQILTKIGIAKGVRGARAAQIAARPAELEAEVRRCPPGSARNQEPDESQKKKQTDLPSHGDPP